MEQPAFPSSTCVLLRDAPGGAALEVLLMRRHQSLSFHGGAWVFPGGRVDPGDRGDDAVARARAAAVRETREEAGLEVASESLLLDAHWVTPLGRPKRFATWFFWARTPAGQVVPDGNESTEHRWLTPGLALSDHAAGRLELPPPTFVTLVKLSAYLNVRAAEAALARRAPEHFTPKPVSVPGGLVSLYEGDAGYAAEAPSTLGPRNRLWMLDSGWNYERAD